MTHLAFATLMALGFGAAAMAQQVPAPPNHATHAGFKEADTNGDGRINRAEAAVIDGLNFELADLNGDRVLTRQEFAGAVTGATPGDERFAASGDTSQVTFEQADKNQDGRVDADEARYIDGLDFATADSDDDRALTRAEYRTAMVESGQRG
jgi:hypothetical protein